MNLATEFLMWLTCFIIIVHGHLIMMKNIIKILSRHQNFKGDDIWTQLRQKNCIDMKQPLTCMSPTKDKQAIIKKLHQIAPIHGNLTVAFFWCWIYDAVDAAFDYSVCLKNMDRDVINNLTSISEEQERKLVVKMKLDNILKYWNKWRTIMIMQATHWGMY